MISTLYQIFASGDLTREDAVICVVFFLLTYGVLIFVSLPVHELAHGLVAYWLGDNTAKWNGRLTLNPLKHLDIFGTLMMVLCGYGFAKPVPVNPMNFRNPRVGMALTALAGPTSNFILVILSVGLFRVLCLVLGVEFDGGYMYVSEAYYNIAYYAYVFLIEIFARINITLAVFNLLPFPPLDGSRIASLILPERWFYTMARYERYFTIGLFLLLMSPLLDAPLEILYVSVTNVICLAFGMPNIIF